MADTRQILSWSLQRPCPFRTGDEWYSTKNTYQQLIDLRTIADAETDRRNVAGICITSWTHAKDNAGNHHDIPSSGFNIEKQLGAIGGLPRALETCTACEANAKRECAINVAGCFGHLTVSPDSSVIEEQLWRIINKGNLEQKLRAAFPVTTPLWYGFWINSPLQRLQVEFLHELLTAACDNDPDEAKDLRHFMNVLMAAIQWELPIHVALAPLGHTDFNWYTIFPHCPRCKANAPVGRWKESYPDVPVMCHVCRHTFNPNENRSQVEDKVNWGANLLENQLGDEGYQQFIKTFLHQRGCTPQQIDEIIDNKNDGPLLRRISEMRRQRNATLNQVRLNTKSLPAAKLPATISFTLAENVELELVLIPAGEFMMGVANSVDHPTEAPRHLVRIPRPFYMGRFTVTQAQWLAVMGKNNSKHQGDPQLPADQVSWLQAQEFCEKLCQQHGRAFRLPSEAEWEYACRAGTTTQYSTGETLSPTEANFTPYASSFGTPPADPEAFIREMELAAEAAPSTRLHDKKPVPVGSYPPNPWGLHDMHGNVDEWCEDVWHTNYDNAPTDGSPWLAGEDKEPYGVVRGGWCAATEHVCTSSSRSQLRADAGEQKDQEEEGDNFMEALFDMMYMPHGFRVVCE